MRILACNPDTLGDAVLRQPLFAALQHAGHELALTLRPLVAPIARFIAPGALILPIEPELYHPLREPGDEAFSDLVNSAKAFDPDILLVTPFQWTALEERLHAELPRARLVAMKGYPYTDPAWTPIYTSLIAPAATVDARENEPELLKNQRLAREVIGSAITLPRPRLEIDEPMRLQAQAELVRLGLEAGEYWVACVGHTQATAVRNWSMDRWASLLAEWSRDRGRASLFVGHESEADSCAPVVEAIRSYGGSAATWFGAGDASIEMLMGLVACSAGYVGRDTGPMHLAAAMDKPVLAVFGQGTWPRFLPAATRSVSLAMRVPCAGCGWRCHLKRSHCIQDVPLENVRAAAADLEEGRVVSADIRLLEPPATLIASIVRESAAAALKVSPENLMNQFALLERAVKAETSLGHVQADVARAQQETAAARQEVAQARAELDRAREELASLQTERARDLQEQAHAAQLVVHAKQERDQLQRELVQVRNELEDARRARAQLEAVLAESERRRDAAEHTLRHAKPRASEPAEGDAELRHAASRAQAEKAKAVSELHDQRLLVAKLREDVSIATRLTRQREQELDQVRQRLAELMASRWRKVGQRLGVAMTMPWEREIQSAPTTNGKH